MRRDPVSMFENYTSHKWFNTQTWTQFYAISNELSIDAVKNFKRYSVKILPVFYKDFILRLASLYSGFNSSYFKSSAMSLACPIPNYGRRGLLSDTRGRLHSAPPDVTYVRKLMAKSIGQDEFMQIKVATVNKCGKK